MTSKTRNENKRLVLFHRNSLTNAHGQKIISS